MVTRTPAALTQPAQRTPQTAAAGPLAGRGIVAAAARAIVVGWILVVTKPEEPHEPDDQQADVEDPEADHEDPSLGGHVAMVPPIGSA